MIDIVIGIFNYGYVIQSKVRSIEKEKKMEKMEIDVLKCSVNSKWDILPCGSSSANGMLSSFIDMVQIEGRPPIKSN